MLCYIILYYIILYYIILYYITLYYIILYYNVFGPPSYMGSVVDRNVVMRRMTVYRKISHENSHVKGSVSVRPSVLLAVCSETRINPQRVSCLNF